MGCLKLWHCHFLRHCPFLWHFFPRHSARSRNGEGRWPFGQLPILLVQPSLLRGGAFLSASSKPRLRSPSDRPPVVLALNDACAWASEQRERSLSFIVCAVVAHRLRNVCAPRIYCLRTVCAPRIYCLRTVCAISAPPESIVCAPRIYCLRSQEALFVIVAPPESIVCAPRIFNSCAPKDLVVIEWFPGCNLVVLKQVNFA